MKSQPIEYLHQKAKGVNIKSKQAAVAVTHSPRFVLFFKDITNGTISIGIREA